MQALERLRGIRTVAKTEPVEEPGLKPPSQTGPPPVQLRPDCSRSLEKLGLHEAADEPTLVDASTRVGWCCAWLHRVFLKNVDEVEFFPSEYRLLIEEAKLAHRAAQFVAWRQALLFNGMIFYCGIVTIDAMRLASSIQHEDYGKTLFVGYAGASYEQYFDGMTGWIAFASIVSLLGSASAVLFAIIGWWYSSRYTLSKDLIVISFALSFVPQFVVAMVIPYNSAIDFYGIQQQMCHDVMNATETGAFSGVVETGALGDLLSTGFGISLPDDFCEQDPGDWGTLITDWLTAEGVLYNATTDSCPRADQDIDRLEVLASEATTVWSELSDVNAPNCSDECANCTTDCKDYLVYLGSLVNVYGAQAVSALELKSAARSCQHCYSPNETLQCAWACPNVSRLVARLALTGRTPPDVHLCLDPNDLADFTALLTVATDTTYWQLMVGCYYALMSASTLAPLTFTLLLGGTKGAGVAKSAIPFSRVPGIISASAAFFSLPFVAFFCVLFQNIMGNWTTFCGVVFALLGYTGYMKPGLFKANSEDQLRIYLKRVGRFSSFCFLMSVILLTIALIQSSVLTNFQHFIEKTGVTWDYIRDTYHSEILYFSFSLTCSVLGKSLISTVFFADLTISIMYHFHHGEDTDSFQIRWKRAELVQQFGTIYTQKSVVAASVARFVRRVHQTCPCFRIFTGGVVPVAPEDDVDDEILLAALNMLQQWKAKGSNAPNWMKDLHESAFGPKDALPEKEAAADPKPDDVQEDAAADKDVADVQRERLGRIEAALFHFIEQRVILGAAGVRSQRAESAPEDKQ